MQILCSVFNNIINLIRPVNNDQKATFQIITGSRDLVIFSMIYYVKDDPIICISYEISTHEFSDDPINFSIDDTCLNCLINVCKKWPDKYLNFEDQNWITTTLDNSFKFIMHQTGELIESPALLRPSCTIDPAELKKIFEIIISYYGNNSQLTIELTALVLKIYTNFIYYEIPISNFKGLEQKIILDNESINMILRQLFFIKSKTCSLYIEKGLPFVIKTDKMTVFTTYEF